MRVTGQIQEVTVVARVSGLWYVVCNDVFKCFSKIKRCKIQEAGVKPFL